MSTQGFVKAASNNLPTVNMFMVTEFIKNDDRFNAPEFRGVKETAATREQYGDSAIGYVELKREGSLCFLQCRICPEHKVRSKNYTVVMSINEQTEKVETLECKDCAASLGGCKHALAFLMWMHRRSEEPSPTDVTSYWVRPRLSKVGTLLKFVMASELTKARHDDTPEITSSQFKEELIAVAINNSLEGQLIKYSAEAATDKFEMLSLHKLLCNFHAQGGEDCEDFVTFATSKMTNQVCLEAERMTKSQSHSPLWHEIRFGRVTASKLLEFAHCQMPDGTLVSSIIGAYKVRDTKHMQRGRMLEKEVLRSVERKINCNFAECGIFLYPSHPVFGASPDGISQDYVIEIKCPTSEKHIKNYLNQGQINNKFKAQLHLQMLCTGKRKGLFCVADPKFEDNNIVNIVNVEYDEHYINALITKAFYNWKKFIYPKLYESIL